MMRSQIAIRFFSILFLASVLGYGQLFANASTDAANATNPAIHTSNGLPTQIRRVLDNRCVVCHGCYSSPCNLKLDSVQGLERGASKDDIYGTRPFITIAPNRLFEDAQTLKAWRSTPYAFHSVTGPLEGKQSIALQLLEARHLGTNVDAKTFSFDPENSRSCAATQEELDIHLKKNSDLAGMPYGTAPMSQDEFHTLTSWLQEQGEPKELSRADHTLGPQAAPVGKALEDFLNRQGVRESLVARYIYEHLYSAHLNFEGAPVREFYRLVRASNREGDVQELPSRRPFDSVAPKFFYRLKKITETIVQKNHAPFNITHQTLARWQQQFLQQNWTITQLPAYGDEAANPFLTFQQIPAAARYRFFLDNAYYFIRTFIHGPVCNGQGATNVIRDHFWVFMIDPKYDLLSQQDEFEEKNAGLLDLPASRPANSTLISYRWRNLLYQLKAGRTYKKILGGQLTPQHLWDGEHSNRNAALTVYRHFKSAGVYNGLVGSAPQTIWVMDYSIFERIYYDLVAGFDVYGNSFHKITTRLYMDLLRTESEDMYLSSLSRKERRHLRMQWNRGFGTLKRLKHPFLMPQHESNTFNDMVTLASHDNERPEEHHARRFYAQMQIHQGKSVIEGGDPINKAQRPESPLSMIMGTTGSFPRYFPEVTIVRIEHKNGEHDSYTLLANKDRPFANHLFLEPKNPEGDVLNLVPGLDVTHINLFMNIKEDEVSTFVKLVQQMKSPEDWYKLVKRFGIGRMDANFWAFSDWAQSEAVRLHPERGGIIDITRFDYAGN